MVNLLTICGLMNGRTAHSSLKCQSIYKICNKGQVEITRTPLVRVLFNGGVLFLRFRINEWQGFSSQESLRWETLHIIATPHYDRKFEIANVYNKSNYSIQSIKSMFTLHYKKIKLILELIFCNITFIEKNQYSINII